MNRVFFLTIALLLTLSMLMGCEANESSIQKVSLVYESHISNVRHFSYRVNLDELSSAIGGKIVDVNVLKSSNGITTARLTNNQLIIEFDKGMLDEKYPIYQYGVEIEISYVGEPKKAYDTITVTGHNVLFIDFYNGKHYPAYLSPEDYPDSNDDEIKESLTAELLDFQKEAFSDPLVVETILNSDVGKGSGSKEIALLAHRYIKQNFDYDGNYYDLLSTAPTSPQIKSIFDFLKNEKGVCYQMAYFYKAILDAHNIENRLVYGHINPGFDPDDPYEITHVWNQVYVDGEWISVDNTSEGENFGERFDNHIAVYTSNV